MSIASSTATALPLVRGLVTSDSLSKNESQPTNIPDPTPPQQSKLTRRRFLALLALLAAVVVIIVLVVVLPVYFVVIKPNQRNASGAKSTSASGGSGTTGSDSGGGGSSSGGSSKNAISGGDGSRVVTENGTVFTYHNPFGGIWIQDPSNPFNDGARPNSWTPPLNTSWNWGADRIYGVNLGGWLVIEPFITPRFFQQYPTAKDEWDLSIAMANDVANGGISQLENHYDTFISEQDVAEMAGAGLNFIRVPIPFGAIETWDGEPFLARTSWKYFLRFLGWARKYGMRVCIDLHSVPGSQNGYNHSGRLSTVNFLNGNMGLANAERTLYYIRVLTEFISQPQYRNLIPIFGVINEPLVGVVGMDQITSFYLQTHDMMRAITGYGEGHGPYIAIHDGFMGTANWDGFLQGSDRIMMDKHNYFSFGGPQTNPLDVAGSSGLPGGIWPLTACNVWGPGANSSRQTFGVAFAGEFAASPNDCGLFLRGPQASPVTSNCGLYDNWQNYTSDMTQGIKTFVMASMDAFGDWFFWTWKIGAAQSGEIETPLWSYQLGYRNGWIPSDPRQAVGMCQSVGYTDSSPWDGTFLPWQTGTTSSIPASSLSNYPWPPATISHADVPVTLMPTYTDTATVITMPVPTYSSAPRSLTQSFNGWFDSSDSSGGITTVAGCTYPDEYTGSFSVVPTAPCTGPTAGTVPSTTAITKISTGTLSIHTSATPTA